MHGRNGIYTCHLCNYSDNTAVRVRFHEENHHHKESLMHFLKDAVFRPEISRVNIVLLFIYYFYLLLR